jgi:hypothetical protein
MSLHDWSAQTGWDGVHTLWISELLRFVKPRLPAGYRAYVGCSPTLTIGAPPAHADVQVRQWTPEPPTPPSSAEPVAGNDLQPDEEVAVSVLTAEPAVYVACAGHLVAAIELVSPRNKDRHAAQDVYVARYLGYLHEGVHLLLVDVHRYPLRFSFADRLAQELQRPHPACPAPMAISYRVGEPAPEGGRLLAIWRRPLAVDSPLPTMPLPLTVEQSVPIDLEATYARAAADAYLT